VICPVEEDVRSDSKRQFEHSHQRNGQLEQHVHDAELTESLSVEGSEQATRAVPTSFILLVNLSSIIHEKLTDIMEDLYKKIGTGIKSTPTTSQEAQP